MDTRDALAAAHAELFAALHHADPAATKMERVGEARCSRASGIDEPGWSLYLNQASGLGLGAPATEQSVDDVLAFYGLAPRPFIVAVEPDARPRALAGWIEARGLRRRLLLARAQRVPQAATAPLPFRMEVIGPDAADTYVSLASHGLPAVVARAVGSLVGRPGWKHVVAFEHDIPVAGAALYVDAGIASFCWTATHPAHRRRGAHAALIAHRLALAAEMGCSTAVAETLEPSSGRPGAGLRNLVRAGFQVTQNVRVYVG